MKETEGSSVDNKRTTAREIVLDYQVDPTQSQKSTSRRGRRGGEGSCTKGCGRIYKVGCGREKSHNV
jgi:hypothetical protein